MAPTIKQFPLHSSLVIRDNRML